MRVVVALGGNAILRRGEPMTAQNQRAALARACPPLAELAAQHELVITHGNGPQVGLLALQGASYDASIAYPFDVLDAETEGMLGYLIEQELDDLLPADRTVVSLVTRVLVDLDDPAFGAPTKLVGPVYAQDEARRVADLRGWQVRRDGNAWRRVVPSPAPLSVVDLAPIRWILEHRGIVICAGGGGVPIALDPATGRHVGVEAVVDKDATSALLASDLGADLLVVATDVDGVYLDWGTPEQRRVVAADPEALDLAVFPPGSMRPKVAAAVAFARAGRGRAVIGSLDDIARMVEGGAGTQISHSLRGITTA